MSPPWSWFPPAWFSHSTTACCPVNRHQHTLLIWRLLTTLCIQLGPGKRCAENSSMEQNQPLCHNHIIQQLKMVRFIHEKVCTVRVELLRNNNYWGERWDLLAVKEKEGAPLLDHSNIPHTAAAHHSHLIQIIGIQLAWAGKQWKTKQCRQQMFSLSYI